MYGTVAMERQVESRCFKTTIAYTYTPWSSAKPFLVLLYACTPPPMSKCFTQGHIDDGTNFQLQLTNKPRGHFHTAGGLNPSSKLLKVTEVVVAANQSRLRMSNLDIDVPGISWLFGGTEQE